MNRYSVFSCCLLLVFFFVGNTNAYNIDHNGSSISYGTSWDNPPDDVETVLLGLEAIYGSTANLTLVNGIISDEIEKWYGAGVVTIMLAEIAGYANNTDFGWYNTDNYNNADNSTYEQIFDGPVSPNNLLTTASITFDNPLNFGFYIDPNGIAGNRMFTEHGLNSDKDYQVTIWQVNGLQTDYILGWEDLDLNGSNGSDRDYQDMIVSLKIVPVPEPASMFLLGSGLIGLAVFRKRSRKS